MLNEYDAKRNFGLTPEPAGAVPHQADNEKPLKFAIQEHHASHLHWDLRLELDGVLKSWAVPKGPSLNPQDKRLAVMVEDHPLAYGDFEGIIPAGQYGAGQVILWDRGIYAYDEPDLIWNDRKLNEQRVRDGIEKGKLSITFQGVKLKGSWALVKIQKTKTEWLLLKHRDAYASETIDILKQSGSIKRPVLKNAQPAPFPSQLEPMLAERTDAPFNHDDWAFEPKLDGVRAVAFKQGDKIRLMSRGGQDITARFPEIAQELKSLGEENAVLDGELIQFDDSGKPSFAHLMETYNGNPRANRPIYYLFDVLYAGSDLLTQCPYQDRRLLLEHLRPAGPGIRLVDSFPTHGIELFRAAEQLGFEGVVGKRLASTYLPGQRSTDWRKVRTESSDDFAIIGYLEGRGGRKNTFRSLLLGRRESGDWHYCGNVGSGFDDSKLDSIFKQMQGRLSPEPIIRGLNPKDIPGNTAPIHWVQPDLTAEIKFHSWTPEGRLRFPVFIRLRDALDIAQTIPDTHQQAYDTILAAPSDAVLTIEGHQIRFTNLDKVLFQGSGGFEDVTKRDLLLYYCQIAKVLLPHFSQRPLAYVRYPHGITQEGFFQKHAHDDAPAYAKKVPIWSEHNDKAIDYITAENLPTLLWLAQLGALEIHPWQSRAEGGPFDTEETRDGSLLYRPDFMVIDLDPYKPPDANETEGRWNEKSWRQAVEVALKVREVLQAIGLTGYLKTSGKSGLHVFVPVVNEYSYAEVRAVAKTLGQHVMALLPHHITMELSVKKRPAKLFFDSGQNVMGKTLAGAYSARPVRGACVSFPMLWGDLESALPTDFTIKTVPELVKKNGDAWADILTHRQRIV